MVQPYLFIASTCQVNSTHYVLHFLLSFHLFSHITICIMLLNVFLHLFFFQHLLLLLFVALNSWLSTTSKKYKYKHTRERDRASHLTVFHVYVARCCCCCAVAFIGRKIRANMCNFTESIDVKRLTVTKSEIL